MTIKDEKWLADNLGMLTDEVRGDVLKTVVVETEKTKRFNLEQQEQTRRNRENNDGFHAVRGAVVVTATIVIIVVAVCSYCAHKNEVEARVKIAEIQQCSNQEQPLPRKDPADPR